MRLGGTCSEAGFLQRQILDELIRRLSVRRQYKPEPSWDLKADCVNAADYLLEHKSADERIGYLILHLLMKTAQKSWIAISSVE